ncbi:MAG: hypothetical protein LBS11_08950 [Oscillospiraceae bacterium]|jgi:hypothetical protein|nr:hypothetical protein [Oscillospiraceae bacterium]
MSWENRLTGKRLCAAALSAGLAAMPLARTIADVTVFPQSGIRLETSADERVITPRTLGEHSDWLAGRGLNADALAASYYAERVLFEVVTDGGVSVTMSERDWPDGGAGDIATLEPFAAFADSSEWVGGDWFRLTNAYESICQIKDISLRSGMLIELTARAPWDAGMDAALAALESIKPRVQFIDKVPPTRDTSAGYTPSPLTGIARTIEASGSLPLTITALPAWTGGGQIAAKGATEPGARVALTVDGREVGSVKAGADGLFAFEFELGGGNGERRVALSAERGGSSARSVHSVLVAQGVTPLAVAPSVDPVAGPFDLYVYTLPEASIELVTPSQSMRGPANSSGYLYFSLSVRRGQSASYTVTAAAPGLAPSTVEVTLERVSSETELIQDFRANARSIPYQRLSENAKDTAGQNVELRGRVGAVGEQGGLPALVLYTSNPGLGSWQDPVLVYCGQTLRFEAGDVLTVLGAPRGVTETVDGETMPVLDGLFYLR